jgi:cell division protein FtsW (lipid II flippase)
METHTRRDIFQILNALGYLLSIIINGLANALPINGKNTGEISDSIPNLFVPAGLTFSIWGLIYLLQAGFAGYQIKNVVKKEKENLEFVDQIGIWFFLGSIANTLWVVFWHYEFVSLTLVFMIILLVSLLTIYIRLGIGKSNPPNVQKWTIHLPTSVYLGWITVATIANVTAVLVTEGWNGWGISEEFWTVLVIIVAVVITSLMLILRKDIAYALVVMWALLGIWIKRTTIGFENVTVATTALVAILFITVVLILTLLLKRKN